MSQGLFFVEVILYDMTGNLTPERLIACGHSPMAILFAVIPSASIMIVILVLEFRNFKNSTPLASSCSAAISAACHAQTCHVGEVSKPSVNDNRTKISIQENDGEAMDISQLDSRNYRADEDPDSYQGQANESQAHLLRENNGAGEDIGEAMSYIVSRLNIKNECSLEEITLVESNREDDGTTLQSGIRSHHSNERNTNVTERQGNNTHSLGEETGSEYGHCCFSPSEVTAPSAGKLYM